MKKKAALRLVAVGAAASLLLGTAACSSGGGSSDAGGDITLNVGVFGSFGFKEAGLYDAYMKAHPNIKIVESSPQNETDYWNALQTRLAGNSGLADIQAIEVGRMAQVVANQSNKFVDFNSFSDSGDYYKQFLPWKLELAKSKEGAQVAVGTDIGPIGMCYKPALFKAAGLPTDPAEVGALWNSWSDYVAVGKKFTANAPAGAKWTDSAAGLFRAAMGVTGEKYTNKDGQLIWSDSNDVKTSWNLAVDAAKSGETAKLTQFTPPWNQAFSTESYASIPCPAWMLTYIKGQAGDAGKGQWAVAKPPAPGNVGGAYLSIPKASKHANEAWDLIKFLTSATSQQAVFEKAGNFPTNNEALTAVKSFQDPYFSNSKSGDILATSAAGVPAQVIGPKDNDVETALMNALNEVDQKGVDPDTAWKNAEGAIKAAVG